MYKYDIVIVDTGIEMEHTIFSNTHKIHGFGVECKGEKMCIINQFQDRIGHGTAVTGIIASKCPLANICMIKIFEDHFEVSLKRLIYALSFIEKNIECKIINLSVGITNYSAELENICDSLSKKGCIIVSAFDNAGAISYPAAFNSVIGVDSSDKCKSPDYFMVSADQVIDVLAYGYNHRVAWLNNTYLITQGSSFSAAYITAKLYNGYVIRRKKISMKDAKNYLVRCSPSTGKGGIIGAKKCNQDIIWGESTELHQITNAAFFPFNKEMHSIINFSHLLPFNIRHIYDIKQLGKVGRIVKGLQSEEEFMIENIDEISWSDIDTFIIGHLDKISILGMGKIKSMLLEKCLKYGINVYTFDNIDTMKYIIPFLERGLWLRYPNMDGGILPHKKGKLHTISAPVLGIFGTSSNQGKFTLQLQLREYFLKDSYCVGQVGTEPSSLLFGMDKVFAYGYASHLQLSQIFTIEKVNELLYEVDKTEKDIILIGGQSGTIPVYSCNLKYYNIHTMNVLMGANPDGIILCVNLFDSIEYLTRCVNVITNLVDCKIIALAISPLTIKNSWQQMNGTRFMAEREQLEKFRILLNKEFSLKSYIIGTEEIKELYYLCLDFYS